MHLGRWLLVDALELLNRLQKSQSAYHPAEDDVLVVEEGQWGARSYVKLGVVRVFLLVAFAHAQQAGLRMLHVEGLVRKLVLLQAFDAAALDVHAGHNSVDKRAFVAMLFFFAETDEVAARDRRNI